MCQRIKLEGQGTISDLNLNGHTYFWWVELAGQEQEEVDTPAASVEL